MIVIKFLVKQSAETVARSENGRMKIVLCTRSCNSECPFARSPVDARGTATVLNSADPSRDFLHRSALLAPSSERQ